MYGISVFLEVIARPVGSFIRSNDETRNQWKMDVAGFFIRTSCAANINESFNFRINGSMFRLKLVNDMHGPLRILSEGKVETLESESKLESKPVSEEEDGDVIDIEVPKLVVGEEIEEGESSQARKHSDRKNCMNMDKGVSIEAIPLPNDAFYHIIQESIVHREQMDIAVETVVEYAFQVIETHPCFPNPSHVAGKLVGDLGDSNSKVMGRFDADIRNIGPSGGKAQNVGNIFFPLVLIL